MTEVERAEFINLLARGRGLPPVYDLDALLHDEQDDHEERPALREQRPADNRPNEEGPTQ